jgi:hypothetical protein
VKSALAARRQWITPRQGQLLTGRHSAQRIGERAWPCNGATKTGACCAWS